MQVNQIKSINFSGEYIDGKYVENVQDLHIEKRTIVVNLEQTNAYLSETNPSIIPAFSSTILENATVEKAKSLLLIQVVERRNIGSIVFEEGWNLLGDIDPGFPNTVPLWKSSQDDAGIIEVDPYYMAGQSSTPNPNHKEKFMVKVNLWFAPSFTDCAIHNMHDFIEIHTQIVGLGRMQKFKVKSFESLYEDILMAEGYTQIIPFCTVHENQKYTYPWHQYYSDTDCIWMANEYHPIKKG